MLEKPQALTERNNRPYGHGPLTLLAGPERIESGWWDSRLVQRTTSLPATKATCCCGSIATPARGWRSPGLVPAGTLRLTHAPGTGTSGQAAHRIAAHLSSRSSSISRGRVFFEQPIERTKP
jgi:hypothetical protein